MLRVKTWRKVVFGAVLWLKTPTVNSTGAPSVAMGDVDRSSWMDRLEWGVMFSPLGPRGASATSMRLRLAPVPVRVSTALVSASTSGPVFQSCSRKSLTKWRTFLPRG